VDQSSGGSGSIGFVAVSRSQRRKGAFSTQVAHFGASGANIGSFDGIAELSRRAVQYHQAGKLADAESCYRQVLAIDPNHFDSLHLLGVIAHQSGQSDLATNLISKAIATRGGSLGDK